MGCCSLTLHCVLSSRTSPCPGRNAFVCFACRWLCSSLACCWPLLFSCLLLVGSFHRLSPSRRMSTALRAHRRFDVLLAVLVPVLLYFVLLFTTDSLAVVLSRILTTGFLTVAPSLILSRDTFWKVAYSWMPRMDLQYHYSALRSS